VLPGCMWRAWAWQVRAILGAACGASGLAVHAVACHSLTWVVLVIFAVAETVLWVN